jgi:hypothetical protein
VEAAFCVLAKWLVNGQAPFNLSLPRLPTSIMVRVFHFIAMETTQVATESPMAQRDRRA